MGVDNSVFNCRVNIDKLVDPEINENYTSPSYKSIPHINLKEIVGQYS